MKALTIKQPWASLIAHGIKDVENRRWKTNHRGRIYIHAAAKPAFFGSYVEHLPFGFWAGLKESERSMYLHSIQHRGAIIGEVDIVDCIIHHPSIWAEKSWIANNVGCIDGEGEKDHIIYKWVLAKPVLYDEPILNVKGRLSLWEFDNPKL